MRASRPQHVYSPATNDNGEPASGWRWHAPRWAAAIALGTLLGATTVNALTARELQLPPDFDQQIERLVQAIMLMPCPHREPGYPDVRVADLRAAAARD